MTIDVKKAVKIAKDYIADLYQEESITEIGLEEVKHDVEKRHWLVTIGFFRNLDAGASQEVFRQHNRLYKQVVIQEAEFVDQGKVLAVNNYEFSY